MFPPLPSAQRCYALGQAVGRAIAAWPEPLRVVVMGSGSFSLEVAGPRMAPGSTDGVPDPDWALRVIRYLEEQQIDKLIAEATEHQLLKAGNVGGELLNWIAMLGAIGNHKPNYVAPQMQNGHASTACGAGIHAVIGEERSDPLRCSHLADRPGVTRISMPQKMPCGCNPNCWVPYSADKVSQSMLECSAAVLASRQNRCTRLLLVRGRGAGLGVDFVHNLGRGSSGKAVIAANPDALLDFERASGPDDILPSCRLVTISVHAASIRAAA